MGLWANSIIYYLFDCKGPTRKPSLAIAKTKLYIYLIELSVISMTSAHRRHLVGPVLLEDGNVTSNSRQFEIRSNHMLRKCQKVTLSLSTIERCEMHLQKQTKNK